MSSGDSQEANERKQLNLNLWRTALSCFDYITKA